MRGSNGEDEHSTMSILDPYIQNVNKLKAEFQNGQRGPVDNQNVIGWINAMTSLANYLIEQKRLESLTADGLGDLSDIPKELLRELSVRQTDDLDDQILEVMRGIGGTANLDQILVGLFRKFKIVQTRRFIQNKCYRLVKKDLLFQSEGERAVFTLERSKAKAEEGTVSA